jgi:hypothetical protein
VPPQALTDHICEVKHTSLRIPHRPFAQLAVRQTDAAYLDFAIPPFPTKMTEIGNTIRSSSAWRIIAVLANPVLFSPPYFPPTEPITESMNRNISKRLVHA